MKNFQIQKTKKASSLKLMMQMSSLLLIIMSLGHPYQLGGIPMR